MDSNDLYYNTREVITLQAGPVTNLVCAHYWNYLTDFCAKPLQPSSVICHQTLLDGSSHSWFPRALCIDFADSVDYGLSCGNDLSVSRGLSATCPSWSGRVQEIYRSTATTGSGNKAEQTFYNGSSAEKGKQLNRLSKWNVCLSSHLQRHWMNMNNRHGPVCHIPDCLTKFTETVESNHQYLNYLSALPSHAQGRDILRTGSALAEDFEDRLRQIAEHCDRPTGFHLLTDAETGIAGVASSMLDHVVDEFPNRAILTVPIYQTAALARLQLGRRYQLMSRANQLTLLVGLESLSDNRAAWLPLDVSAFTTNSSWGCLATGLTAACFDCLSTPLRLADEHKGIRLDDLVSSVKLATGGRRMLSARFGFIDITNADYPLSLQWKVTSPYFIANSDLNAPAPCYQKAASFWRQLVLRGIPEEEPTVGKLMRCVSSPPAAYLNGETTNCNWCLPMHSGVKSIHSFTAGSHLCIQRRTAAPFCDQPTRVCAASLLDSPSADSPDVAGLVQLVKFFLQQNQQQRSHLSSKSPIDGIENDLWLECLERARCLLLGTYSVLDGKA